MEYWGTPLPPRSLPPGPFRQFTKEIEEAMLNYLHDKPSSYLDEVSWFLFEEFQELLSENLIGRTLKRLQWSRKVVSS
jgi:hypothetical protein